MSAWVPLAASAPLQFPDAVHPVALLSDQVIVVDVPAEIVVLAKLRLGVARVDEPVTVSVTEVGFEVPLALEQVSV